MWKASRLVLLADEPETSLREYLDAKGYRFIVIGNTPEEWERAIMQNKNKLPGCDADEL
jgi:hypothetical protein